MKIQALLLTAAALSFPSVTADEPTWGASLARDNPPAPGAVVGTVSGRILFDGERPELPPLEIDAEKAKGCAKPGTELDRLNRSLLVSKELGLKNVVVSIAVPGAKVKVPEKPVVLDQVACVFEPHVILLPVGATVEFKNSDTVSHNVRTLARKHDSINNTVPPADKAGQAEPLRQLLDQGPDKIEVKCDFHPWMNAWLYVLDTPYAAVTDADGKFEIPKLEPGEYKLTLAHERLPKVEATVVVRPDGTSDPVNLKMAEKKKKRE